VKRKPDFIIGPSENAYLLRWWIIPRNRWFNIYLHQIRRDDDDRALHDHPWWNLSIILKGCYREIRPGYNKIHRAGSIVLRSATTAHRLELVTENGGIRYCWSLFITGPRIREWYFHCPKGLVHWKDFVDETDIGNVGRGCGEHQ
jgi:hypothetical protein